MFIEIISSKPQNTISITEDHTVVQIVRFPSGNYYKKTYPFKTREEARGWARELAKEEYAPIF
jgi:hypothetical protein